jgi:hypothetical protein
MTVLAWLTVFGTVATIASFLLGLGALGRDRSLILSGLVVFVTVMLGAYLKHQQNIEPDMGAKLDLIIARLNDGASRDQLSELLSSFEHDFESARKRRFATKNARVEARFAEIEQRLAELHMILSHESAILPQNSLKWPNQVNVTAPDGSDVDGSLKISPSTKVSEKLSSYPPPTGSIPSVAILNSLPFRLQTQLSIPPVVDTSRPIEPVSARRRELVFKTGTVLNDSIHPSVSVLCKLVDETGVPLPFEATSFHVITGSGRIDDSTYTHTNEVGGARGTIALGPEPFQKFSAEIGGIVWNFSAVSSDPSAGSRAFISLLLY